MKYEEVSKALFNVGFTQGIRNIRKMEFKYGKFCVGFSDIENITQVYLSVSLKTSSESSFSCIIRENDPKELEKKIEKVVHDTKVHIITFMEKMHECFSTLEKENIVNQWR